MISALLEVLLVITAPVWTLGPVFAVTWVVRTVSDRRSRDRPQAVRNPVQIETTGAGVVSLADVVAHLTATGSGVAEQFLTDEDRVALEAARQPVPVDPSGTSAPFAEGGVLLLPDGTDVAQHLIAGNSAVVPMVIRTVNLGAARRLEHGTKAALAREAARIRKAAYEQLLRDHAARPTLGRPRPHGQADRRNLLPQAEIPRPPPRPSPGRPSRQ